MTTVVEYRNNSNWDIMFFENTDPMHLKIYIEDKADELNISINIEDTQMNSSPAHTDARYRKYDILVFYTIIEETKNKSKIKVKD